MRYKNLEKACSEILNDKKDTLSIMLGGSRARGDNRKDSDYDFMIITQKGKGFELSEKYRRLIAKKAGIDEYNIGICLMPLKKFEEARNKGNSMVYDTLRLKKILASRKEIDLTLPKNLSESAKDRLKLAKRDINYAKFFTSKEKNANDVAVDEAGYATMHLCWAICMLHNKCPKSKYTALEESKKYFPRREFEIIKKTYRFYSHQNFNRVIKKYLFMKLLKPLERIADKIYRKAFS